MTNLQYEYKNAAAEAERAGHKHDTKSCTVNALAIVTGLPWQEAQRLLAEAGRRANKGFAISAAARNGTVRGWRFTNVMPTYLGMDSLNTKLSLCRFVRTHPRGRFYLSTRRHAFALIDGKINDWLQTSKNAKLTHAWLVTPVNEPSPEVPHDPLMFVCPKCHARQGQHCVRANGQTQHNTHRARRAL